jgi:rod shape-determining protein MreC
MRYFLLLLKQSRILILFLILEVIALYWTISVRSYPRAQYLSQTTEISGRIASFSGEFQSYLNLKIENEHLANENSILREQLNESLLIQNYGADTINDSILNQRYSFLPAKVLHTSYLKLNNFIIIDKGSRSGIKVNMGVIGPQGVVGKITSVSSNFARIIPLINNGLTISATLEEEDYFGPLQWTGVSYRNSTLSDIPRYSAVKEGDKLFTDGRSKSFPAGVAVGYVAGKTLQADQNFYSLNVVLATDFSKIKDVYIVKDIFEQELDSIINDFQP